MKGLRDVKVIEAVRKILIEEGTITSMEAIQRLSYTRLSDAIFVLRNRGWNIISVWEKNSRRRWVKYCLVGSKEVSKSRGSNKIKEAKNN